jgi:putative exosortase-associated protein (TIGR04073 family)
MKKIIFYILIIVFISNISFADVAMDKLKRGALNFVMSPKEIIYGINQAREAGKSKSLLVQAEGWDSALTWGVLNGVARMTGRAIVGIFEVVTSPFPIPKEYKPILTDYNDPQYFLHQK